MVYFYQFFKGAFVCLLTFVCMVLPSFDAYGQWTADFSSSSSLTDLGWRHDVSHFRFRGGRLSLSGQSTLGEHVVAHSIQLSGRNRWQGRVQLDKPSTIRNHAYVLLYAYEQDREEGVYRYVAVSIGGGKRHRVSLVSLDLESKPKGAYALKREAELISTDVSTSTPGVDVSFDVRLGEDGLLQLYVRNNSGGEESAGSTRWRSAPIGGNSLGFMCLYTKSYAEAMHLSTLSLTHEWSERPTFPEVVPEIPEKSEGSAPADEEIRMPIITELMVNPDAKYDEYVEIYNPNTDELELDGIYIGIGRNRGHLRFVSLEGLPPIPAGSYVVLTSSPDLLLEAFPSADPSRVYKVQLPAMSNSGCSIALRVMGDIVDYLDYSSALHDKGLASKRGIALERTTLSVGEPTTALWRSASKSRGYATPTRANSRLARGGGVGESGGLSEGQEDLFSFVQMVEESPEAKILCSVYTIEGMMLYQSEGSGARSLLRELKGDGNQALSTISSTYRGVLLLVFDFEIGTEVQRYVLKAMRH